MNWDVVFGAVTGAAAGVAAMLLWLNARWMKYRRWVPNVDQGLEMDPPPGWSVAQVQYLNDTIGVGRDSLTIVLIRDASW